MNVTQTTWMLMLLLAACGPTTPSAPTLRFTAIPNQNKSELRERFDPLARHLTQTLDVAVEYVPCTDYGASVEAFKNGDVHLAWFGGLTGVRARAAVADARAIAQGRVDPEYKSYFIAHRDSGLTAGPDFPGDLAGRRFTFGSNGSTSGRLMPEYFIRQFAGKTPAEFFGEEMHFSGSHDATAKLVESGQFEAGVLDYKIYERLVEEGKLDAKQCIVIWETPPYADYNWTAHPELETMFGDGFIAKVQRALIDITDAELLRAMDRPEGLIEATNEDFESIRQLAIEVDLVRS